MKTNVAPSSLASRDRQTSHQLIRSHREIVAAIKALGGGWVSRRQIAEFIADVKGERVINTGAVSGRVNELVTAGRLEQHKTPRQCPITGRGVHMVRIKESGDE
jgi:hypothetical protein